MTGEITDYRSVLRAFREGRIPGLVQIGFRVRWPWWLRLWWACRRIFAGQLSLSGGWVAAFGFVLLFEWTGDETLVTVYRMAGLGFRQLFTLQLIVAVWLSLLALFAAASALGALAALALYARF